MLFTVLTSSAVGLAGLLIAAPAPVDALVAPGSGSELGHLAARRLAGVSSNHHALARRKSNAHKKRQRCQQRPVSAASTPAPQPSSTDDNSGTNNYVGGNDNNNDNIINLPSNPATTTTAQPAPTENYTPPAPAGNGKLMLAWPNGPLWTDGHIDTQKMQQYFTGKASLYYNWAATKTEGVPDNIRYCPMLWGYKNRDEFRNVVKSGYSDCVIGMNEVNQEGQSIMSVGEGVQLWNEFIAPLQNQGYRYLVSPSTTSAPNGLDWVKAFLASPLQVQPNIIAIHWYDVKLEDFKAYAEKYHSETGYKEIWITEFACQNFNGGPQCDDGYIWEFIKGAVLWMDNTDWIGAYAPFGFMRQMQGVNELNRLMEDNDNMGPTDKGYFFIHG